jgi:WG containing repeat
VRLSHATRIILVGAVAVIGPILTVGCTDSQPGESRQPQAQAQTGSSPDEPGQLRVDDAAKQQAPPIAAFRNEESLGKYGFINRWGVIVLKPHWDYAADFVDGLACVQWKGTFGFLEPSGRCRFTLPAGTRRFRDLSEGMIWFLSDKENRWGLCDDQGHVILAPTYDDVKPFSGGLAAVNVGAKVDDSGGQFGGKWGYVNKKGEVVVPIECSFAGSVSDGLALVSDSTGRRFLDKSGKAAISVEYEHSVGDFREGLAPVHVDRSRAGNEWLTRFIDRQGKTALTVDGFAGEFHEGLAVLLVRGGEAQSEDNRSYGYIDHAGKVVIRPRFAEAHDFSEGLAAVRTKKTTVYGMGDTWGYIDQTGKYQIEAVYNEAHSFVGGVARVHLGGTRHVVFDAPPRWAGGEWWLIDTRGKKLMRFEKD